MVQSLEPRAMAAVAGHSEFRHDFWGRLQRTNDYVMTVVYGPRTAAQRASGVVRVVHSRVSGVDPFTRKPYRADEPQLLEWIQNATLESYLAAYRRHGPGLSQQDADRYVGEMRTLGMLVGLSRDDLPENEAGLNAYMNSYQRNLAASPAARQAVRTLLNPELPLHLKPLWGIAAADAYASVPDAFRHELGIPYLPPLGPGIRLTTAALLQACRLLLPPPPIAAEAMERASQSAGTGQFSQQT